MVVDVLIENGLVVDGTGEKGRKRALAILGDKLVLPEAQQKVTAGQVIDAQGLVVAPGFIDIHSHSTIKNLLTSLGGSKLSQGITTEISGNCGQSPAPLTQGNDNFELSAQDIDWSPEGYSKYLQHFDNKDISLNYGFYVGHGSIRAGVMGWADRKPSSAELEKMKYYVAESMKSGAVGLSTGLVYPPGMFSQVDELVELCKVVVAHGGIYATHMRSESNNVLQALDEAIDIARRANIPLHVSHLKATGRANWGKVAVALAKLEEAEGEGLDVSCDFYPYTASSTSLNSQLPNWVHAGGWIEAEGRLQNPTLRERIVQEVAPVIEESVGWQSIVVSSINSQQNRGLEGKNLEEIGLIRKQRPVDALIDLLLEENGSPGMIKFSMSDADVSCVAAHRLSMVGSDGIAMALDDPRNRKPHPRNYGAFPRVFRLFHREQALLTLEETVYKMTAAPASRLRLPLRGLIKDGYFADIVLFAAGEIGDTSSYTDPHQLSRGIHSVYVNGKKAYSPGQFLNPKSGVLVKPQGI
jgi:N-acyl-D-amino-acid deacylase